MVSILQYQINFSTASHNYYYKAVIILPVDNTRFCKQYLVYLQVAQNALLPHTKKFRGGGITPSPDLIPIGEGLGDTVLQ